MAFKRFWAELKSSEFAALDPHSTLAILPVAATEQHGPHLPVMTDTAIAEGMIKTVLARLPDDLRVLFLAVQTIGKSNEHLRSAGTITCSADNLTRIWCEIGEGVHRAGLRKLVIVNSHGGNNDVIGIVGRDCACGSACWSPPRSGAGSGCRRASIRPSIPAMAFTPATSRLRSCCISGPTRRHDQGQAVHLQGRRDGEGLHHLRPAGQHGFGGSRRTSIATGRSATPPRPRPKKAA
jgi:Uncharacterized protein, putative amidase